MKNFMGSPEEIGEMNKEEVIINTDVYEDDEEEKIEAFFALVRGYQEARNRRRNELKEIEKTNKKKMRSCGEGDRHNCGWVPAFQWEDFTHESENRKHPQPLVFHTGGHASLVVTSSIDKKKDKKMEQDHNNIEGEYELDLTLAL